MQAVCPHDKIKCSRRSMLELDIDSVLGLRQRADRVAEEILASVSACLVNDLGKLATHDLDVPLRYALRAQLRRHIDGPVPSPEKGDDLRMSARVLYLCQRAHPLDDLQSRAEKINGMSATAKAKLRCFLHDRWPEPKPG